MPIDSAFLDAVADSVDEHVRRAVAPLVKRIEQLESRPELRYCGTYQSGVLYRPGEFCTRGGSLWLCLKGTMTTPGLDDCWRLVVKQGQA